MTLAKPRTYTEALELLDARRKGLDMPEGFVLHALMLTGDYEEGKPDCRYREPSYLRLYEREAV